MHLFATVLNGRETKIIKLSPCLAQLTFWEGGQCKTHSWVTAVYQVSPDGSGSTGKAPNEM